MSLQCGIVGLPNVGKSTLFNALCKSGAQAANYPFCTIDPNVGIVTVPDPRLDKLVELVEPQNVVPAAMEFVDIAGLVKGASQGEGLGNQFLGNIRTVDAIIHVVRCFEDDNITHVDGSIDPIRDRDIVETELQLKDLESLEKRRQKLERQSKTGDKDAVKELDAVKRVEAHLLDGESVRSANLTEFEQEAIEDLALLTAKPILYACNVDEASAVSGNEWVERFSESVANENAGIIVISAEIEAEISVLDDEEDREAFLSDLGLEESGLNRLIRESYKLLKLMTYFTAGKKEVRAWTIPVGFSAPKAAGTIHTDFERGFIRAEVIAFDDWVHYGSELACKEAGKMRVEGKEYIVKDGDVMHFRFNV